MKRNSRQSSKHAPNLRYEGLESRQLLAGLFQGTPGDDIVKIDYVDDNTIDITINEVVHENVDATDLVRINLGVGNDRVTLDDRVDVPLSIALSEIIEVVGSRDNDIKIGFKPSDTTDPDTTEGEATISLQPPGMVAGRINDLVTFIGAREIHGDSGNDRFTVRTDIGFDLKVYGGGGDDIFWFSEGDSSRYGVRYPVAFGGDGSDRFVFRNETQASAYGEEGYDTLDYSQLGKNAYVDLHSGEKIIGATGQSNLVRQTGSNEYRRSDWFVNGDFAQVKNVTAGTETELYGFSRFHASSSRHSHDRLWLMKTASDVEFGSFDWAQVSSDLEAINGNLDAIQHDVNFVTAVVGVDPTGSEIYFSSGSDKNDRLFAVSGGGYQFPVPTPLTLIVSNATGEGSTAEIRSQEITGLSAAGTIWFANTRDLTVVVHGSLIADDVFVVHENNADLSIYTHGGDDMVMVGGTVKEGGRMVGIQNEVFIGTGVGEDRVIFNDQLDDNRESTLRKYRLAEGVLYGSDVPNAEFATVRFSGSTEVVRVNAATDRGNQFTLTPSQMNRFVLHTPDNEDGELVQLDSLTIENINLDLGVLDEVFGSGSWRFPGRQSIFFDGIFFARV